MTAHDSQSLIDAKFWGGVEAFAKSRWPLRSRVKLRALNRVAGQPPPAAIPAYGYPAISMLT